MFLACNKNPNALLSMIVNPRTCLVSRSKPSKRLIHSGALSGVPRGIPASFYRGGTSRAIMFNHDDLPRSQSDWPLVFLGALGSPDPYGRQLDGLGGGISSLSKICVVSRSKRDDADVDFTFAQVGVKDAKVDFSGTCGNMTSAVGPFGLDQGMIEGLSNDKDTNVATVRIYNTNTSKVVQASFPVEDGVLAATGDLGIDGVPGLAAPIRLDFMQPAGSVTGDLLPTGSVIDRFDGIQATCIDCANPMVFVLAEDLGVDGTMLPPDMDKDVQLLQRLDSIRRQAAIAMGMARSGAEIPVAVPKISMLSPPKKHMVLSGGFLDENAVDIVARAISVGQPHRALPITMGLCLAAAASVPGSVASRCLEQDNVAAAQKSRLRIGHPSGTLLVEAQFAEDGELRCASVYRTARRLMEGTVYWR